MGKLFEGCASIGVQMKYREMRHEDIAEIFKVRASTRENRITMENPDPAIRAYGFYRKLGWIPSGEFRHGKQVLKLRRDPP
jgi:hypothetical protein